MSKLNTGKASILVLTAVLAFAAFLLGKSLTTPKNADARVQACYGDCPKVTFSDSRVVTDTPAHTEYREWIDTTYKCPSEDSAYTHNSSQDSLHCKRELNGHWKYANKIVDVSAHWGVWSDGECHPHPSSTCQERQIPAVTHTDSFGPIDVQYGTKSEDPNHCHRPTGESLGVPSWAMNEFNKLDEHKDREVVACPISCIGDWNYTQVCSVTCGGGVLQQVFNITTPSSNGGTACTNNEGDTRWSTDSCNTQSCVTDVCANLDGIQETLPDGMQVNENHICSCKDGYHEVNSDGETEEADHIANFTCEPNASPTLSNEGGSSTTSQAGAPVCNAAKPGTPTILSAIRTGNSEELAWSAVANATYYSIVYGNIPGVNQYGVANTGNVTSYTINGLTPGVTYHFAVNAVNDCMPGDPGTTAGTGTGGQVLGASTMAGTGSFEENLYMIIMAIGGIITFAGAKNLKKAFKVAK